MKFSEFKKSVDEQERSDSEISAYDVSTRNLEIILDIVKSINQSLILEDVLELVLKNAIKLTQSDRGFIVLKSRTDTLEYKMGIDSEGNFLSEKDFNVSLSVVRDVFATGTSKFIEGARSGTNYESKSILRLELQTILCSPLITDDKKIGVIYVDSKQLHRIKLREITDTFEILAGQAATAIRNAQLYHGQISAYNALNEANIQLIQAERKALKSSIDSEIGQSLQGLVHLALLENESLLRTIEKSQKDFEDLVKDSDNIIFDRLKLKSKVAIDSIRNIQKYAQVLIETSLMNLNKDSGDLNKTIQSVIKYLSPMKKFHKIIFKSEFNTIPQCSYDSEQIQHILVHLFNNSAEAREDATILIRSDYSEGFIHITVEDNGPGFTKDKVNPFVFNMLSTKRSGYGLFLCKSIIDLHNGEIRILDKEKGAAVKFSLPVH